MRLLTLTTTLTRNFVHNHIRNFLSKFEQNRANSLGFIGRSLYFLGYLGGHLENVHHLGFSNGQSDRFEELPIESIRANFHACSTIRNNFSLIYSTI